MISFSFVSNKIIFILFVAILYFQIKKHYIIIYQLSKILIHIKLCIFINISHLCAWVYDPMIVLSPQTTSFLES